MLSPYTIRLIISVIILSIVYYQRCLIARQATRCKLRSPIVALCYPVVLDANNCRVVFQASSRLYTRAPPESLRESEERVGLADIHVQHAHASHRLEESASVLGSVLWDVNDDVVGVTT